MKLTIAQERKLIRCDGTSNRYLAVNIQAPVNSRTIERLPVNIAIVIDRSGSMHGRKLERACEAACYAIKQLRDTDRFAVIAYDDEIEIVMHSSLANQEACMDAVARIKRIRPGRTTNLFDGWMHGCQQIAELLDEEAIGRCFLLTDGLANRGITSRSEIVKHAGNLRERQVVTSTFGVGSDFDEVLLQEMASSGGGNFYFIASGDDIPIFINQELGETLEVVARDVVLEVNCGKGCELESLNEFPVRSTSNGWRVSLGNLISGQEVEPVLRLRPGRGKVGESFTIEIDLLSDGQSEVVPGKVIDYEYAPAREVEAQHRDVAVDRRVATMYAARAERTAATLNRERDYDGAQRELDRAAERIRQYAGNDPEICSILDSLESAKGQYSRKMEPMMQKKLYSRSSSMLKDRTVHGSARRMSRGDGVVMLPTSKDILDQCRKTLDSFEYDWRHQFDRLKVSRQLVGKGTNKMTGALSPTDELDLVRYASQAKPDFSARIVLTKQGLHDNWFSHWHQQAQTAVVSLNGWSQISSIEPMAYIAYEVLLNGLHTLSSRFDLLRIAHEETRGCLFDFCRDKHDLEIKLQIMDLCRECRDTLSHMRINYEQVVILCDEIRKLASRQLAA
jgi:Ca-activated chloride channel homolog